jgi:PhoD-like phosphatase
MARRARAGHGVYGVKLFDFSRPKGHHFVPEDEAAIDPDVKVLTHVPTLHSNKTVAVFVLDCRTHKTPWKKGSAAFGPDPEGDFLGERQWNWFESAIGRSRASINIVVNGLQVHGERFPDGNTAESWGKYPLAQQRLFDAMLQHGVEAPILVSGDVHMAQLSRKDCHSRETGNVRSLVELTTSGMTHSWGTTSFPTDDPSHKPTLKQRYQSFLSGTLMRFLHVLCPWTELMVSKPSSGDLFGSGGAEGAKTGTQFSLQKNFGELEFDWEDRTVTMRAFGEDNDSAPLLSAKWSMDQLSGRSPIPGSLLQSDDFERQREANSQLESEWVCVNHRGRVSVMEQILGHVATGLAFTLVPFPVLVPAYILILLIGRSFRRARPLSRSDPSRLRTI